VNAPATIAVSPLPVAGSRRAFTLIELLVVFIIIAILAALSLTGLAGARQRAKIDKTKSTIRKIHEIVVPHYESFAEKRVPGPRFVKGQPTATDIPPIYTVWIDTNNPPRAWIRDGKGSSGWTGPATDTRKTIAEGRLQTLRLIQLLDLPDQWADVGRTTSAAARRYSQFVTAQNSFAAQFPDQTLWDDLAARARFQSAECLALIVTRGGFAGDATENFRTDEMGDVDGDNAPEFLDAWGKPIQFIRWPAGFTKALGVTRTLQEGDAAADHDPFDPLNVAPADYRLIPLIYSGGPDGGGEDPINGDDWYGIRQTFDVLPWGWLPPAGPGIRSTCGSVPAPGSVSIPRKASDNITNHDLITK
jgi:prepilin-type N-terminal cleavage/methylation domain-containing protein